MEHIRTRLLHSQTLVMVWRSVLLKRRRGGVAVAALLSPIVNPAIVMAAVALSATVSHSVSAALSATILPIFSSVFDSPTTFDAISSFNSSSSSSSSSFHAPSFFAQQLHAGIPDPVAIIARIVLASYLMLGFSAHSQSALIDMVVEKEKRFKEGLLMQGLAPSAFWKSVHLVHAVYASVVCALITWIISPLFPLSNPFLVFLLLLCMDLANISSTLMFAPLFNSSQNALLFDGFISILLFTIPLFLIFWMEWAPSELAIIFASIIFYPLGFFFGMLRVNQLEMEGVGANWQNSLDGRGIGGFLIVLGLDVVLYMLVALYLDQVVPQQFGVPRPWFFPLKYIDRTRYEAMLTWYKSGEEVVAPVEQQNSESVEPDPQGLSMLIQLTDVVMKFPGASVNAVDGVALNLYQDEIFALLGHNGAGKSTLLHILTGLISPSKGFGSVAGYDLANEMNSIRRLIGVCPQHDIQHDEFTVAEHILLFAGIKGLWATKSHSDLNDLVDSVLSQLNLVEKKHERIKSLSGGQKRKLSVAMAIVGDPKILILDEPTAGMDPVSRRSLWSTLTKLKKGRVTLLTTHMMDEADLVADRKAILTKGRVVCQGTSVFLKHQFEIGYKLDVAYRPSQSSHLHMVSLVHKYIPSATCVSGAGSLQRVPVNTVPVNRRAASAGEAVLVFSLPPSTAVNFPRLFTGLDKQVSGGAVLYYGISMPSLEEVFLKTEGWGVEMSEEARLAEEHWTRVSAGEAVDEEALLLGNESVIHTTPVYSQTASLVYARFLMLTRTPSSTLSSLIFPLYMYSVVLTDDVSSAASSFWIITMSLFFTAITWAREPVQERSTKMDLFLKSFGISTPVYWISNVLTHAPIVLIPGLFMAWLIVVWEVKAFGGIALGVFLLANLLMSVLAMISSYVLGLGFKEAGSFLNFASILTSFGTIIPYSILMYYDNMGSVSEGLLAHVLLSFTVPTYPFSAILYFMAMAHAKSSTGDIPPLTAAFYWSWENKILPSLVGMVVQIFLYGALLMWRDGAWDPLPKTMLDADEIAAEVAANESDASEDPNVALERMRVVKPLCTDDLLLRRVSKVFKGRPAEDQETGRSSEAPEEEVNSFWGREAKEVVAARDVSLGVSQGDIVAILGPNGAGKTTAMSMAIGDILPTKGAVAVTTVQAQYAPQSVQARASLFGQVAQHDTLWPLLTGREHLHLFASLKGIPTRRQKYWIRILADAMGSGLTGDLDKHCKALSGGTKRKVAFLLALVGKPRLLFLDEPSTGIDPKAKRNLWNLLRSLQPRLATLLTTHSMEEADILASRIGIMIDGALKCLGTQQYLKTAYGNGYLLEVRTEPSHAAHVRQAIFMNFPNAVTKESFNDMMERWEIPADDVSANGGLGSVFEVLEGVKMQTQGGLKDFCFGQVSLEMVFLGFAKKEEA
ncbi:P-loop containing nucleoside triphosphate hydrolase protein [Chytriomyces cf. hyalinus JEL632]|nr:P-loop containing nucleoside triphosphate hydrolase protein [Chytriomyces cf. hyalinus JEL632]